MSNISHYYTDAGEGTDVDGPWYTYDAARRWALGTNGRVIEYEYEFSDSRLIDDYTADPVEDVATELSMHWNVDWETALADVRAFADAGGDGSGMTFSEQVSENTAYVVAEYMVAEGDVAGRATCRHCGDPFAFEEDETHGGLCRSCDETLPADHPNRGENR